MNLSKVKLVVSDMDGTLLNSKGEVSKLFFRLFNQLKQQNIHFCAASGRQYNSIVKKLDLIKDDIFIIAENGGIARKGKEILTSAPLSKEKIKKIIPILRTINDAHVVLCGKNDAFIESKNKDFFECSGQAPVGCNITMVGGASADFDLEQSDTNFKITLTDLTIDTKSGTTYVDVSCHSGDHHLVTGLLGSM